MFVRRRRAITHTFDVTISDEPSKSRLINMRDVDSNNIACSLFVYAFNASNIIGFSGVVCKRTERLERETRLLRV